MANVPNILPDTRPDPRPPDDYQHQQANPQDFGAGVAQGVKEAGQGVSTAAQHFGEIQTDDVTNTTLTQGNNLITKLHSLKGEDALRQGDEIRGQLKDLWKQGREQLGTSQQQLQYDRETRVWFERTWPSAINQHLDQQATEYGKETNDNTIKVNANNAAIYYNDPKKIDEAVTSAVAAADRNVHLHAGDGPVDQNILDANRTDARASTYAAAAKAMALDPKVGAAEALKFWNAHKSEVGAHFISVAEELQNRADIDIGQSAATEASAKAVREHAVSTGLTDPKFIEYSQKLGSGDVAGALRLSEVLRTTPYWDQNHLRTGYGSDTVTQADGTHASVTATTKTTPENAERDLQRRTQEYTQNIQRTIGADRWASLSQGTQAALTSIAYNYGHLPSNVENAVRSGGPEDIAKALASHATDGPFDSQGRPINYQRRLAEANAVISGTGGPVIASTGSSGYGVNTPEEVEATPAAVTSTVPPVSTASTIPAPATAETLYAAATRNVAESNLTRKQKQVAQQELDHGYHYAAIAAEATQRDIREGYDKEASGLLDEIRQGKDLPNTINKIFATQLPESTKHSLWEAAQQQLRQSGASVVEMGAGYSSLFKNVVRPDNEADRIKSIDEILWHARPGGDLTLRGRDDLVKIYNDMREARGRRVDTASVQSLRLNSMEYAEGRIYNNVPKDQRAADLIGKDAYQTKFLPAFTTFFDDWVEKNPRESLDKFPLFHKDQMDMFLEQQWPQRERDAERFTQVEIPEGVSPEKWLSFLGRTGDKDKTAWANVASKLIADPSKVDELNNDPIAQKAGLRGDAILAELGVPYSGPKTPFEDTRPVATVEEPEKNPIFDHLRAIGEHIGLPDIAHMSLDELKARLLPHIGGPLPVYPSTKYQDEHRSELIPGAK